MPKRGKKTSKPAAEDPRRDEKGRIRPGHTLNPGGVPKAALELRTQALTYAPLALRTARKMVRSDNPFAQNFGITHILNRALGKDGSAAELPTEEVELPENLDTSPAALHAMVARGFARSLYNLEARSRSRILSPSEIELQTTAASGLSKLLAEERELAKAGAAGSLPDAELRKQVLAKVPAEELEAELAARKAAQS